jgi:glycosyltransferase XagB
MAMAVITEADLHRALAGLRSEVLRTRAETCVDARESCRIWRTRRFAAGLWTVLAILAAAAVAGPGRRFRRDPVLALAALLPWTLLKIAAAAACCRGRAAPAPPRRA